VQLRPLLDEVERTTRKKAVQHFAGRDGDLRLVVAVLRMEVRRRMVIEEHRDHDSVERRDPRH
jgi:hypothetical protein